MNNSHANPGWFLALLLVGLTSGCHLGQPGPASFASVVIADKTAEEVRAAAVVTFTADGYQAMFASGDELLFEKEGTRGNEIAHGGWLESGVRERVRANVVFLAPGKYRLQCQAYMVRHAGDPVFQEEVRLKNFRGRPYQKLLDEVAARLKQE